MYKKLFRQLERFFFFFDKSLSIFIFLNSLNVIDAKNEKDSIFRMLTFGLGPKIFMNTINRMFEAYYPKIVTIFSRSRLIFEYKQLNFNDININKRLITDLSCGMQDF